jgi:hypothetical protein
MLLTGINYEKQTGDPQKHDDEVIRMDELEKVIKVFNGKVPEEDNINLDLYKYAPKNFLLRLLNFDNIYTSGEPPKEWNNAIIISGISLLNTCYKTYAKILNG